MPPPDEQLQQGVIGVETAPSGEPAQTLATAFYRGLGAADSAVTPSIRRRDLVIALQLVEAGATATEAEAYAREAYAREASSTSGRMAPVDLRSFERERLGWLAPTAWSGRVRAAPGRPNRPAAVVGSASSAAGVGWPRSAALGP
jgi:hypothetical protein